MTTATQTPDNWCQYRKHISDPVWVARRCMQIAKDVQVAMETYRTRFISKLPPREQILVRSNTALAPFTAVSTLINACQRVFQSEQRVNVLQGIATML